MLIKKLNLNGYQIPKILNDTTNFNATNYRELDIVNSILRGQILYASVGATSDDMDYYFLRIAGIGEVDKELGYHKDSLLVWGTWAKVQPESKNNSMNLSHLTNEFIGFISGINGNVGAQMYLQLHPVKIDDQP